MKKIVIIGAVIGILLTLLLPTTAFAFNPQPEPPASENSMPHQPDLLPGVGSQFGFLFPDLDVGPEMRSDNTVIPVGSAAMNNPMRLVQMEPLD